MSLQTLANRLAHKRRYKETVDALTIGGFDKSAAILRTLENSRISRVIDKRGELKHINSLSFGGGTITVASGDPSSALVTGIAGGDLINQREGNTCRLKRIRMNVSINASNTASVTYVRFIVFIDRQPVIGTPATYSQVMSGAAAGNEFVANRNIQNYPRFQILSDKIKRWQPMNTGAVAGQAQCNFRWVKSFKKGGMKLRYTDATATNVLRGHVYVVFATDVAANNPTLRGETQLDFKDPS